MSQRWLPLARAYQCCFCGTFLCTGLLSDYPQLLSTLRQRGFTPCRRYRLAALRAGATRCVMRSTAGWATATGCCSTTLKPCSWPATRPSPKPPQPLAARLSGPRRVRGKRGADGGRTAGRPTAMRHAPTRPVTVIDTIGAGDSNAGFLAALLSGNLRQPPLRWEIRRRAGVSAPPAPLSRLAYPATSP
ncbi:PfkB family carbohydrate kinase [Klebsiella variicola subsp. variicola]|nr:PfkB family carbohydrate kinase [Klebsiella variicola subsp. variicola]